MVIQDDHHSLQALLQVARQIPQSPIKTSNKRRSRSIVAAATCPILHCCSDQCATAPCIAASSSTSALSHTGLPCCTPAAKYLDDSTASDCCQESTCNLQQPCQSVSCDLIHSSGTRASVFPVGSNVCWDLDVCTGACSPDKEGSAPSSNAASSPCTASGCVIVCDGVVDQAHRTALPVLCDSACGSTCPSNSTQCTSFESASSSRNSDQPQGTLYSTFAELLECCCCSEYHDATLEGCQPACQTASEECTSACAPCPAAAADCEQCPPCISLSSLDGCSAESYSHTISSCDSWQWYTSQQFPAAYRGPANTHFSHLSATHEGAASPGLTISTSSSYSTAPTPYDSPSLSRQRSVSCVSVNSQINCPNNKRAETNQSRASRVFNPITYHVHHPMLLPGSNFQEIPSVSSGPCSEGHQDSTNLVDTGQSAAFENEVIRQCTILFAHMHDESGLCQPLPPSKDAASGAQSTPSVWEPANEHIARPSPTVLAPGEHDCAAHSQHHHVCQWAGCGRSFSSVESLVAHVNKSHLLGPSGGSHNSSLTQAQLPQDQRNQGFAQSENIFDLTHYPDYVPITCLWGSNCHTIPAWPAGAASTQWDSSIDQSSDLPRGSLPMLQHLLTDHLGCDPRHILPGINFEQASAADIEEMLCSLLDDNEGDSPNAESGTMKRLEHARPQNARNHDSSAYSASKAGQSSKRKQSDRSESTVDRDAQCKKMPRLSSRSPRAEMSVRLGSSDGQASAVQKSHTCGWSTCTERFSSTEELTAHIVAEHVGSGEAEYSCCWRGCERAASGRKFSQRQKVLRHIQSHTGDRPFACPHCPKRFQDRNGLLQHVRTHTLERPFVCEICSKAFVTPGSLTIHRRTHTGAKPFECTECGKKFSESSNLTKHMRIHTGERPYSCPECGRAFVRPDQVTRHMAVHRNAAGRAATTASGSSSSQG